MISTLRRGAALAILVLIGLATGYAAERPNLIVIMADDLGWKDVHCYGNEWLDTPNIDRLAEQGMLFTDAYAAAPVCSPTRAAMMTGLSPARLHLTNHAPGHKDGFTLDGDTLAEAKGGRNLGLSYVTIAERLKDAGYATAHIGKWHLSYIHRREDQTGEKERALRPEAQGFDLNVGGCFRGGPPSYFAPYRIPAIAERDPGEYLPDRLAEEAIRFVSEQREDPFFLSWWPYSVHYPMQAQEDLIEKYRSHGKLKDPVYAAMIEAMDRSIGRLLDHLDATGLRENTFVLFKSDNGGYNGDNRPLRGVKGWIYEGGIRVPWIVRWPGVVEPGSRCGTPVISMDCVPTLLEVAGVQRDDQETMDGVSIVPLLKQTGDLDRSAVYFHYPNYAFHKRNRLASAMRSGDYKLIKRYDDGSIELYDLSRDIGEQRNLATQRPAIAKRLTNELNVWLAETGAELPKRRGGDE